MILSDQDAILPGTQLIIPSILPLPRWDYYVSRHDVGTLSSELIRDNRYF